LENNMIMIKDFLYVGMHYTGDLTMPFPLGMQWRAIGKISHFG